MSQSLLVFAVVAFIATATPGPTVLLALTNGSRFGLRASLAGMIGAALSDVVLIAAVALGLGALLIPPPRRHRHHYYGVFAPHANLRARITACAGLPVAETVPVTAPGTDPMLPATTRVGAPRSTGPGCSPGSTRSGRSPAHAASARCA